MYRLSDRRWLCKRMVHIPFLIFSFSYLRLILLPQSYSGTYQRVHCQCNVFWPCIAIIITAFYKNAAAIEITVVSYCMMVVYNIVSWKKNNRCSYVFLTIFMFWHSRFSFKNFKDANSCVFLWYVTSSSLLICSLHDMTLN